MQLAYYYVQLSKIYKTTYAQERIDGEFFENNGTVIS
jgi:hypothetical protein